MEQYISQNPGLALVLLVGAWELVRFLGGKGWAWAAGVADKSVAKKDCRSCKAEIKAELRMGDDLFLLLLEGQTLQTRAILHMCDAKDEKCQKITNELEAHNLKLVTHRERRHSHA
ncbi:MAG: hypothetical protein HY910_12165 [Desulfarculus sp.]|nr:hypothetical protein [Desulfarculus sp.]